MGDEYRFAVLKTTTPACKEVGCCGEVLVQPTPYQILMTVVLHVNRLATSHQLEVESTHVPRLAWAQVGDLDAAVRVGTKAQDAINLSHHPGERSSQLKL